MKRLTQTLITAVVYMTVAMTALAEDALIVDDGVSVHVGRMLIITDGSPSQSTGCGEQLFEYRAVIVGDGPATHTTLKIDSTVQVQPGDRFDIVNQTFCSGHIILDLQPK